MFAFIFQHIAIVLNIESIVFSSNLNYYDIKTPFDDNIPQLFYINFRNLFSTFHLSCEANELRVSHSICHEFGLGVRKEGKRAF